MKKSLTLCQWNALGEEEKADYVAEVLNLDLDTRNKLVVVIKHSNLVVMKYERI